MEFDLKTFLEESSDTPLPGPIPITGITADFTGSLTAYGVSLDVREYLLANVPPEQRKSVERESQRLRPLRFSIMVAVHEDGRHLHIFHPLKCTSHNPDKYWDVFGKMNEINAREDYISRLHLFVAGSDGKETILMLFQQASLLVPQELLEEEAGVASLRILFRTLLTRMVKEYGYNAVELNLVSVELPMQ